VSKEFATTAVIQQGSLKVRNRQALESWASRERDGEYLVTVARQQATRSLEMNALYWVGFVRPLAEHTGYTSNEMHAYLKARFLPTHKRRVKHLLLHDKHGAVIDEYVIDMSTTTVLTKPEFGDYLHEIQVFAAELGVVVGGNTEAS
jgi:hypothetical protein